MMAATEIAMVRCMEPTYAGGLPKARVGAAIGRARRQQVVLTRSVPLALPNRESTPAGAVRCGSR